MAAEEGRDHSKQAQQHHGGPDRQVDCHMATGDWSARRRVVCCVLSLVNVVRSQTGPPCWLPPALFAPLRFVACGSECWPSSGVYLLSLPRLVRVGVGLSASLCGTIVATIVAALILI